LAAALASVITLDRSPNAPSADHAAVRTGMDEEDAAAETNGPAAETLCSLTDARMRTCPSGDAFGKAATNACAATGEPIPLSKRTAAACILASLESNCEASTGTASAFATEARRLRAAMRIMTGSFAPDNSWATRIAASRGAFAAQARYASETVNRAASGTLARCERIASSASAPAM
jgi:hypothetical protein